MWATYNAILLSHNYIVSTTFGSSILYQWDVTVRIRMQPLGRADGRTDRLITIWHLLFSETIAIQQPWQHFRSNISNLFLQDHMLMKMNGLVLIDRAECAYITRQFIYLPKEQTVDMIYNCVSVSGYMDYPSLCNVNGVKDIRLKWDLLISNWSFYFYRTNYQLAFSLLIKSIVKIAAVIFFTKYHFPKIIVL